MLFLYGNGRLLIIADYQCKNELAVIWLGHGLFYLFRNKLRADSLLPFETSRRNHSMLTIGVIAIQGAVSEHITALEKVSSGLNCKIVRIKKKGIIRNCDGLVIPGGECTTISKLLRFERLDKEILKYLFIKFFKTQKLRNCCTFATWNH